jgi:hypothetical protein
MPYRSFERRHRPERRLIWLSLGASLVVHALVVVWLVVGQRAQPPDETIFFIELEPEAEDLSLEPSAPPPSEPSALAAPTAPGGRATPETEDLPGGLDFPALSLPAADSGTPGATTTPPRTGTSTFARRGQVGLQASVVPLVATPYGIGRRPRDEARIARMRAESLVNAMIASVVEVKPPVKAGPVSFPEGGGVSIPIPWGGFVRGDRDDETWREERCRGDEKEKGDKAGEEEARQGQCG